MKHGVKLGTIALATLLCGCASAPPAQVKADELASIRDTYSTTRLGSSKASVLGAFKKGNKVKLGSAEIEGARIEEWKVEAFHDQKNRKDLFVAFMYFCDDRLVDTSDTRIDFRAQPELVDRWRASSRK
ncbi:MAG: hypothetical protein IT438_03895 [Phycisphaerales bacterium]|nr:hypothetical protein [Phycisphaerales bacterium]